MPCSIMLKQHVEILRRNIGDKGKVAHEIASEVAHQIRHSHAPRFADRRLSAGQRNIRKVRGALEAAVIGQQHFPSPDAAVGAVAGAVKRDADDAAFQMVLRHAACDVRVMMLHADLRQLGLRQRPARREVARVQIVRDGDAA